MRLPVIWEGIVNRRVHRMVWSVAWLAAPVASAQSVSVATDAKVSAYAMPGGTTVVDIAVPNAAGLSHNRYERFDVDAAGLVLNNVVAGSEWSAVARRTIDANPHLGQAANVILNEVVGSQRSTLAGATEVAGQRADVVIANPYGITCAGCGFINTGRATLATGLPHVNADGALGGFDVQRGDILVKGEGVNANATRLLELVARSVRLDGPVQGTGVAVIAGANRFDYASGNITGPTAPAGRGTDHGIDSTVLGGIHAERIRLVSTDAGTGVRMLGEAAARLDDFTLDAAGQIVIDGRVTAARDTIVQTTGTLINNGSIEGGRRVALRAQELVNHRDIDGGGQVDIEAGHVRNEVSGVDRRKWEKGQVITRAHGDPYDDGGRGGNRDYFQDHESTWTEHHRLPAGTRLRAPRIRAGNTLTMAFRQARNLGGELSAGNAVVLRGGAADGSAILRNQSVAEETRHHTARFTQTRKELGPLGGIHLYGWSYCHQGAGAYDEGCRYNGAQQIHRSEFRTLLGASIHAGTVRGERFHLINDGANAGGAKLEATYARLDLTSLLNEGGRIAGARSLDVASERGISNLSGVIEGGRVALATRAGRISNLTLASGGGSAQLSSTQLARTGLIAATGSLALDAADDLVSYGAETMAWGDATLRAGRNVLFDTVQTHETSPLPTARSGGFWASTVTTGSRSTVAQQRPVLFAGQNLRIDSGGDTTLAGATALVLGDARVQTGGTLRLVARPTSLRARDDSHAGGFGVNGALHGSVKQSGDATDVRDLGAMMAVGGNFSAQATREFLVQGSRIAVRGSGRIVAGNIRVEPAQATHAAHASTDETSFLKVQANADSVALKLYEDASRRAQGRALQQTPSVVSVDGDLALHARHDVRVWGSRIEAGGSLTASAANISLAAAETVVTSDHRATHWAIGWMGRYRADAQAQGTASTGGGWRGDAPDWASLQGSARAMFDGGFDMFSTGSQSRHEKRTAWLPAIMRAGADLLVHADRSLLSRGSRFGAGRDMALSATDIDTLTVDGTSDATEARRSTALGTYLNASAGAQGGVGAMPDGMQHPGMPSASAYGEAGVRLELTRTSRSAVSSVALPTHIEAGRTIRRVARNRLYDLGTRVRAGGDLVQAGTTVLAEAARELSASAEDETTDTARLGLYASASAGLPSHVAGQGTSTMASGVGAGVGGVAGYRRDGMDAERRQGKPVVAQWHGRHVLSHSTDETSLEGTRIEAGGDIRLSAGTLRIDAASGEASERRHELGGGGDLRLDAVSQGGSVSGDFLDGRQRSAQSEAIVAQFDAGGNLLVAAQGDMHAQGSRLRAGRNLMVAAGRDLRVDAVLQGRERRADSTAINGAISAGAAWGGADVGANLAMTSMRAQQAVRAAFTSERGSLGFVAGKNLTLVAPTLAAASGDVVVRAGRDLVLDTVQESEMRRAWKAVAHAGGGLGAGTTPNVGSGGVFVGVRERARESGIGAALRAADADGTIVLAAGGNARLRGVDAQAAHIRHAVDGTLERTEARPDSVREHNLDTGVPPLFMPATPTRAWHRPGRGPHTPLAAPRYDSRLVLQVGDDAVASQSAARLAHKHAGTKTVRVAPDGTLMDALPADFLQGRVKFTMVGHGDGTHHTLGGIAPSQIGELVGRIMRRNPQATLAKLNLAGCDTACLRGATEGALAARGVLAPVTGEQGDIRITDGGRKVKTHAGAADGLGGPSPPVQATAAGEEANRVVAHPLDELRRVWAPEEAAQDRATMQQRLHGRVAGVPMTAADRLVLNWIIDEVFPVSVRRPITLINDTLGRLPDYAGQTYYVNAPPAGLYGARIVRGDTVVAPPFLAMKASLAPVLDRLAMAIAPPGHKIMVAVVDAMRAKPLAAYSPHQGADAQAEVVYQRGTRFKVVDIDDTPDLTYLWLAEAPDATAPTIYDLMSGQLHHNYRNRIVVPLADDFVTQTSAERLRGKHVDAMLVPLGADGQPNPDALSRRGAGTTKISLVGHGDPIGGTVGGKSAAQMAAIVVQVAGDTTLCKVSLVGCHGIALRPALRSALASHNLDPQISGRIFFMAVDEEGRKVRVNGLDMDALGGSGRPPAQPDIEAEQDTVVGHYFDRMRAPLSLAEARREAAEARQRVVSASRGAPLTGHDRQVLNWLMIDELPPRGPAPITETTAALGKLRDFGGLTYHAFAARPGVYGNDIRVGDVTANYRFMETTHSLAHARLRVQAGHVPAHHKAVLAAIDGLHGKPVAAFSNVAGAEVTYQRGTRYKVNAIRDTPAITYAWLSEIDAAPNRVVKDIGTGVRHRGYPNRIVVPLEADGVTVASARRLSAKHATSRLVPLGEDGMPDPHVLETMPRGKAKLSMVGHGDGMAQTLGKKDASALADIVKRVGSHNSVCKLSLVGCNSIFLLGTLLQELDALAIKATVTGRLDHVLVGDDGRKNPTHKTHPDALAGVDAKQDRQQRP